MFQSNRERKEFRRNFRVILSVVWTISLVFVLFLYPPDHWTVWAAIALLWLVQEIMIFTFSFKS